MKANVTRKAKKPKRSSNKKSDYNKADIAIIGMACRFPGANDYREFADNLLNGVNSIKEIPPSRWDIKKFYSPNFDEPNKSISKWCGLIDNIDKFDNQFFNISPREANNMDPQQRLLLEETWHCIEDSGVALNMLQQKNTAVYVGVMAVDYHHEVSSPDVVTDSYACLGNYECILANRISYMFNLQGASLAIDAACASSLVAIHEAKRSLIMAESDYALASGVSLNFHPWKYISFSKSRMLSPDGQCKTFDMGANGYVPGEGVGVILMQRLEDAIADGNHIYGIIKGSAVNHGGKTLSITAPRVESQKGVILSAYKNAGISPDTITYIEAHGTGTSLGDPIEIESLAKAFREYTQDKQFCRIGSVKTNIGHLEAGAGLAGVIKVLIMMHHRKIPKSLHIKKLNPIIDFKNSPFVVATEISDWQPREPGLPLRAGVSSFGFGGVNSHVVLEKYLGDRQENRNEPEVNQLFLLSARSSYSIKRLLEEWREFVNSEPFSHYSLREICTNLKLGRGGFPYRYGAHVRNKTELKELLQKAIPSIPRQEKKYWCLRIGDFSFDNLEEFQAYLERFDLFKKSLQKIEKCLLDLNGGQDALMEFHQGPWPESSKPLFSFMVAYAGVMTLIDLGFMPDVITGEKAGVLVGLVLSGIMKLEDALAVLSKEKELKEIEFTRPTIPYYDSILKTTVMPFNFNENYLRLLVDELGRQRKLLGQILVDGILYTQTEGPQTDRSHQQQTLLGEVLIKNEIITKGQLEDALNKQKKADDPLGVILVRENYCSPEELAESLHQQDMLRYYVQEVFRQYVDKARLLNANQFTYKKLLEEWDVVLKKSGKDLLRLLYDDQIISLKGGRLRNEKLLLMVIIISCLRRLNQKWNLTEQQIVKEKRFYELVDLVTDEVMSKEDLVDLLLSDSPDYASIAHNLNKRQVNRNLSNAYRYLKGLNSNIREIEDVSSWLINAMEIKNVLPEDSMAYLPIDNIAFFEIGVFNEPVPFQGAVHLKIEKDLCELFTDSLLKLWLQGVDIIWSKLYQEGSYRKVVLPLYPFDRKSFWLRRTDQNDRFGRQENDSGKGAPLSRLQTIDQEGLRYKRSFSMQDPIIQYHIITGRSVIPGASLIELGLEALQKAVNRKISGLQGIVIQNPGVVDEALTLEALIDPEEGRFTIKDGAATLCSGRDGATEGMSFTPIDLSSYTKNQSLPITMIYQIFSSAGYQYGDGLKVIDGLWQNDGGFLVSLKKSPKEEGQMTPVNPRTMDGIFQSALAAGYLGGLLKEDDTLYVPYFIKFLRISGEIDGNCFVCIEKQDIQKRGDDLNAQLRVYDQRGNGVLWIQDMLFKRVSNRFLTQHSNSLPKSGFEHSNGNLAHYYKPCFIRQAISGSAHSPSQGAAILFIDEEGLGAALYQEAALRYQKVFSIKKGAGLSDKGNNLYEIDPSNEEDYKHVIHNIDARMKGGSGHYDIYHLWAYEPQAIPANDCHDLQEKQEKGVKSLFFLAKALGRAPLKNPARVAVVTQDAHAVEPDDIVQGFGFGGLFGMARTIMMEHPRIDFKMIDFGTDGLSLPAKARAILDEGISQENHEIAAYRKEGRYVRTIEPLSLMENGHMPVFRDKDVYMLIGGAGGIGMKVAEMITKQVKARLILLGRSALSSEKRRKLEQLQTYNNEILYIQGDVTNQGHMKKLLKIIKARYGTINGVIHTGGVLEDRLLVSKDWESFHRVMASKVYGAWIINQLTRTEPLDFFIVFSSIVSIVGNIGQVDYAAANSFLDAFINYRARNNYPGKSIGINWTLWADGGMGIDDSVRKNFEKRGLKSISSDTGLKVLERIIQHDQPCQLAVAGQRIKEFENIF